jgi:hypothetical protein
MYFLGDRFMKIRNIAAACVVAGLASTAFAATSVVTPLIAGQHTVIGEVMCTMSTATSGACAYDITVPGWCLTQTHLYVGATLPRNAAPGQFPYQTGGGCAREVIIPFKLSDVGLAACPASGPLVVMAHAAAVNTITRQADTAWGSGPRTGLGGWSMSFGLPCGQPGGTP